MSNDPLPHPGQAGDPLADADYDACYAELAATERGRHFLAAHATRARRSDTRRLMDTIARLDAAARDDAPAEIVAALQHDLADLATATEQVAAALTATDAAAEEGLFAAERAHDIAIALRHRDVETNLCDALDVAIRQMNDAMVGNNAAAKRAASAGTLLRDLARTALARSRQALISAALADFEPDNEARATLTADQSSDVPDQSTSDEFRGGPVPSRFDDTAAQADVAALFAETLPGDPLDLPGEPIDPSSSLLESQAEPGPDDDPGDLFAPENTKKPDPGDEIFDAAIGVVTVAQISTMEPLRAAGFSAAASERVAVAAKFAIERPTHEDPLADVLALSEDELIALFS